jgi:hypothetical protein
MTEGNKERNMGTNRKGYTKTKRDRRKGNPYSKFPKPK